MLILSFSDLFLTPIPKPFSGGPPLLLISVELTQFLSLAGRRLFGRVMHMV